VFESGVNSIIVFRSSSFPRDDQDCADLIVPAAATSSERSFSSIVMEDDNDSAGLSVEMTW